LSARASGAGAFQRLHLVGGENLRQLGLGFFFQGGNLLLLVVGQVHLRSGKGRNEMKPATAALPATLLSATLLTLLATTLLTAATALLSRRVTARRWPATVVLSARHRHQHTSRQQRRRQQPHRISLLHKKSLS
jgi:hypothetical protein